MGWINKLIKPTAKTTALARPWGGEEVNVDTYWAQAWVDLAWRQSRLARDFKLAASQWTVDQDQGIIRFDRTDGALVTAPIQIVGSWNPKNEIFTWGWDHPSVQTRLRGDAERTRWFGDKHNVAELTDRTVRCTEAEAWRMTAVAAKVNAASGAYRGPTEGPVVFMTLGELKVR